MSRRLFHEARTSALLVVMAAVGLAFDLSVAGCSTTTTTAPVPAVSTGADVERCQASGSVWRNGMCTTMGGGGY